jgi:uncharacterized protein (TIGR02996 family)
MRTFTFKEGNSDKFWNIELHGNAFTVTYGRSGSKGQTQTKTFADAVRAKAAHDKLVNEKLGKGYVETTAAAAAPAAPVSTLARELEAAILDDPDDRSRYAALADCLIEQGDPRGEFIQVQLALEEEGRSPAERKELQKREKALLKKHQRDWLGPLAKYVLHGRAVSEDDEDEFEIDEVTYRIHWGRGFLESLEVNDLSTEFAAIMATAPQLRLLRRLVLEGWFYDEQLTPDARKRHGIPEHCGFPALYPLRKADNLTNVRVFQLGEQASDKFTVSSGMAFYNFHCHTYAEAAADVIRHMPRVEELYLLADELDTHALFRLPTLDHLRLLQIYHSYRYPLETLAANPALSRLTHLLLHPKAAGHWSDDTPYIKFKGVRAILNSPHLHNLTHLQLRLTDIGDRGCDEIVRSGVLRRLKSLDLRHGTVTDDGAGVLAGCLDIANLELLDLSRNRLSAAGIRTLKKVVPSLRATAQQEEGEEEGQYLYEGDIE